MFQLVIAVYGYIMATGIGCFVLLFVVLFKRPVNSENKLCRSTNMLSPLPSSLHSMPDGTNGRLFGHRQGQNFVDGRPGDTTVDEQDDIAPPDKFIGQLLLCRVTHPGTAV